MKRMRTLGWREGGAIADDPLQPFLMLNMETGTNPRPGGQPVDSSPHEDAALALWDPIASSIRLRKVGVSSASSEINPVAHFNLPCLYFSNAKRVPDEILFDIPGADDRTVSRQPIPPSVRDSIATSVSTLP